MVICVFSGTLHPEAGKYLISIFHYCDIDCLDGATHQVNRGERENKKKTNAALYLNIMAGKLMIDWSL